MAVPVVQLRCGVKVSINVPRMHICVCLKRNEKLIDIVNAERRLGQDGKGVTLRAPLGEDTRQWPN